VILLLGRVALTGSGRFGLDALLARRKGNSRSA